MKRFLVSVLCLCMAAQLFAQNDTTSVTTTKQDTTSYQDVQNDTIAAVVHVEDYIKRRGTMMTVAVKNNPEVKDKNIVQFLSTLPGVDGLKIYGNTEGATVYVNGRKMDMPNISEYLQGFRAEDVRSIQVIPTHGAKYSADTKGGVIRIQLRSREEDRISGNAALDASVYTHNGALSLMPSVNLNYMGKKLSSYTYVHAWWLQDEPTASEKIIVEGEDQITEKSTNDRGFYSFMADQSFLWTLNDRHEIGFGVRGMAKPRERSIDNILTTGNRIQQDMAYYNATAALNYNWYYDDKGSSLKLGADFLYTHDDFDQDYYTAGDGGDDESDTDASASYEHSDSRTNKYTWSMTADGDQVFGDGRYDLSYGAFWLGMNAKDKYNQYDTYDVYGFNERMYGAYAEFTASFLDDKLNLATGLRYEGYRSTWSYQDPYIVNENFDRTDGSNSFNSLFPTASLSYRSPNGKSYTSLEYGRDISRPGMYAYTPSVERSGDNVFFVSPTTLLPEFENSISLTETVNNAHTFRLSYSWERDITGYTYLQDGDQIYKSEGNVGSSQKVNLYFSTRFWIVKDWLRLSLSGTGYYKRYLYTASGNFGTWGGNATATASLYLPKSWTIQASGYYYSPTREATYWSAGMRGLEAAVQKSFDCGLLLSVRVYHIVSNITRKTVSKTDGVDYTYFTSQYFRSVRLYLTYKFGSSKVRVKHIRNNYKVSSRAASK